jgi:hypothetical protein
MSIQIDQRVFDGPFLSADHLAARSGVYAILGRSHETQQWSVVDVGESADLRQRVTMHDRAPCWRGQGHSTLAVAAHYCNAASRMLFEARLRAAYQPPCGKR